MNLFIDWYGVLLGVNASLNKYGGRSFATVISFAVGLVVVLLFFAIDVTALRTPLPTSNLKSMDDARTEIPTCIAACY